MIHQKTDEMHQKHSINRVVFKCFTLKGAPRKQILEKKLHNRSSEMMT